MLPILDNPERVCINAAALILGLVGLVSPPEHGVLDEWPYWLQLEWSASIVVAGVAALHGTWTGYRPSERLGAGLFTCCAVMFAIGTAFRFGVPATGTIVLFGFLALAKVFRIIRSLAISAEAQAAVRLRRQLHDDESP
jgi:hypothetical protein